MDDGLFVNKLNGIWEMEKKYKYSEQKPAMTAV